MDIVDKPTRSRMMAGIRSKNTSPEMIVRRYLHRSGFRYTLHDNKLPGSPDLVLRKYQTVIFVHGCFWHRHDGCQYATWPKSNEQKWKQKFEANVSRDTKSVKALVDDGWTVIIVWECGLRRKNPETWLGWLPEVIRAMNGKLVEWPAPSQLHLPCDKADEFPRASGMI